jgi:hypothetical protein
LAKRGLQLSPDWNSPTVPAWGACLLPIQLCVICLTTALAKLLGMKIGFDPFVIGVTC